ncbi:MAG TPA: DUF167 domain-containing protein [Candidatus Thermoplasmatota archaeon]|nr:DUF167 domain-containing protein [Candidatus Thermoplasmatota archaeon]
MTSPSWTAALAASRGGTSIHVEVVPGARESRFPAGYNPWRRALEARVRAQPEEGAANAELVALVATYFGVPRGAVTVAQGATSRRKVLLVTGLGLAAAKARLAREPNL